MDSTGKSVTDRYTNLTASSYISIYAPQSVTVGNPPYGQVLTFKRWYLSGTAAISDVNSNSTAVYNFQSNVSVNASY